MTNGYLARRLDVPSRLLGRVGDDALAGRVLHSLFAAGVDLRFTQRVPGRSTSVALIVVRADGEKSMLLAANANDAWGAGDAEEGRAPSPPP